MGGKGSGRQQISPCGTRAKYVWHRRRGENCELCKQAERAYQRARYQPKKRRARFDGPTKRQQNREIVRLEKFARGACMDCGLVIDQRTIVCIDFDHRDPQDKAFTIAHMMSKVSKARLQVEMAKCDAVCRNCHAIRTHEGQHHLVRRHQSATVLPLFDN